MVHDTSQLDQPTEDLVSSIPSLAAVLAGRLRLFIIVFGAAAAGAGLTAGASAAVGQPLWPPALVAATQSPSSSPEAVEPSESAEPSESPKASKSPKPAKSEGPAKSKKPNVAATSCPAGVRNHGAYVSSVAKDRSVSGSEHGARVSAAARSNCGKKPSAGATKPTPLPTPS